MSTPYFALLVEALVAPLLIRQGRTLRRSIPRLPEPEGAREGKFGTGAPLRVMLIGDSAGAGVGVATQAEALSGQLLELLAGYFTVHWQLHAKTGYTTRDVKQLLADVAATQVDVVITSIGLNDVLARQSGAAFLAAQRALLDLLRERYAPSLILLTAVPPLGDFPGFPQPLRWVMHARRNWLDAQLMHLCREREECEHLKLPGPLSMTDMASDGFHPGPQLYRLWATVAAGRIIERFGDVRNQGVGQVEVEDDQSGERYRAEL